MTNLEAFRAETRNWLEANCPGSMRTPTPKRETPWGGKRAKFPNSDTKLWLERMVSKGWTAPEWPREYGGGELSATEVHILREELDRIGARIPLMSFGYWMLGPVLMEFASTEQKTRFLPGIARGEIRWCQGYSEPSAGSDLASLRTKAELVGDHYLVNGSKIWTSEANESDWMFCLVRTSSDGPKHHGISFLLIDLESPGVEIAPIKLISGGSEFNQVFFDNVKVPASQLVGDQDQGWKIAKRLLQHERQNVAGAAFGSDLSSEIWDIVASYVPESESMPAELRSRIADQAIRDQAITQLGKRIASLSEEDAHKGLECVLKVSAAANNQLRFELIMQAMGNLGLQWGPEDNDSDDISHIRNWLRSKGNSIEGGTSEINLNIIAKNILGLPQASNK